MDRIPDVLTWHIRSGMESISQNVCYCTLKVTVQRSVSIPYRYNTLSLCILMYDSAFVSGKRKHRLKRSVSFNLFNIFVTVTW